VTPRAPEASGQPPQPRFQRIRFRAAVVLVILLVCCLTAVLFLPRLIEGIARHEIERWSSKLGGKFQVEGLALRGSTEVAIDHVTWRVDTDWELTIEGMRVDVDPFAFLMGGRRIQRVRVERLKVSLADQQHPLASPKAALHRLQGLLPGTSKASPDDDDSAPVPSNGFRVARLPDLQVLELDATAWIGQRQWTIKDGHIDLSPSLDDSVQARRKLVAKFLLDEGDGTSRRCEAEVVLGTEAFEKASIRVAPSVIFQASIGTLSAEGAEWAPGEASIVGAALVNPDRWFARAERMTVRWDDVAGPASLLLADRFPSGMVPAARSLLAGRTLRSLEILRPSVDVILDVGMRPATVRPEATASKRPATSTTGHIVSGDAPIRESRGRRTDVSTTAAASRASASATSSTSLQEGPAFQIRMAKWYQDTRHRFSNLYEALLAASKALPEATLVVHGATVRTLEPGQVTARPGQSMVNMEARIQRTAGGAIEASLRFECPEAPADANEARITIDPASGDVAASVKASWLPLYPFRAILPRWLDVKDAVVSQSDWTLKGDFRSQRLVASGRSQLAGLVLDLPSVASAPIHLGQLSAGGTLTVDGSSDSLDLVDGRLSLGRISLPFELHASQLAMRPRLALKGHIERLPAQELVDSIPGEILASLDGMVLVGTFAASLDLDVDTGNLDAVRLDVKPDVADMATVSLGKAIDLGLLRSAFLHRIEEGDGTVVDRLVGEATPEWVPLTEVPGYLIEALTTAEDATFFEHKGFSQVGIRRSFKVNLERGGFYQGASTLSQQLVKNLFLSREKTLSRKLQEVFLTWQMEQSLPKEKILELYLNVIEWGPDLWGLREAAGHYFAKRPPELTLLESAYLVTIIPNPRMYHKHVEDGAVPASFERRVKGLLVEMERRKRINPEEVAAALEQHIRFSAIQPPPEGTDDEPPDEEYGGE
jgi:hypothetical protein